MTVAYATVQGKKKPGLKNDRVESNATHASLARRIFYKQQLALSGIIRIMIGIKIPKTAGGHSHRETGD
ncbi:hypothetical protein [Nitrosomonas marina]|uniref:hypothetical protein n=1 Tax=Nitrosomonas marina TaxID=917 RepID=UPI000B82E0F1|nr:hypothetical protein [Nitrosomonas marina]